MELVGASDTLITMGEGSSGEEGPPKSSSNIVYRRDKAMSTYFEVKSEIAQRFEYPKKSGQGLGWG